MDRNINFKTPSEYTDEELNETIKKLEETTVELKNEKSDRENSNASQYVNKYMTYEDKYREYLIQVENYNPNTDSYLCRVYSRSSANCLKENNEDFFIGYVSYQRDDFLDMYKEIDKEMFEDKIKTFYDRLLTEYDLGGYE